MKYGAAYDTSDQYSVSFQNDLGYILIYDQDTVLTRFVVMDCNKIWEVTHHNT